MVIIAHLRNRKRTLRFTSFLLLQVLVFQLLAPAVSYGLTSGPVQPEIQSFEPVGTTDLVDPFTGDFTYNIPLLDVEGYPVNIFYHSGPSMEQEASWVGLGWNINTGCVNRSVRGLPDDFRGEDIEKTIYIKPEKTTKVGLDAGWEFGGTGEPKVGLGLNLGGTLTFNNYRGVSVDFNTSAGVNTSFNAVSAGLNVGASVGSQSGAAVNYGAMLGIGLTKSVNEDLDVTGSFNLNTGGVYSPRNGMRRDVGFSISIQDRQKNQEKKDKLRRSFRTHNGFSTGTSVQIGLQNYTAAVSNKSYSNTYAGRFKIGGELWGGYGTASVHGTRTKTTFESDGTRKGYGYLYLDSAKDEDLIDFSREKDGTFNTTMHFLSPAALTYDVYSISGQGTGGSFRPFRNETVGTVYDPATDGGENKDKTFEVEVGLGNLFEIGGEGNFIKNRSYSGPWQDYYRPFAGKKGGYFEDVYFKEAGELTENNTQFLQAVNGTAVVAPDQTLNMTVEKPGSGARVARANHIATFTADDKDSAAWNDSKALISFDDSTGFKNYPNIPKSTIPRNASSSAAKIKRRSNHVMEIVQTQKDGRRYVYGLPVVNNVQKEATFAIASGQNANKRRGVVPYSANDDKPNNGNGVDHFYSATVTPTFTTAHLLTQVLSNDYSDVTGDGPSDDDIGTYTKFNYSRKSADYRWRSPLKEDEAQYIPGYITDKKDDKASYMAGSREQWILHSIETKNYVAEFYTSARQDGRGLTAPVVNANSSKYNEAPYNASLSEGAASYKLDSIVLYNKHDRILNKVKAVPVKTVIFQYDYSLCKKVPNSSDTTAGKLTLKAIFMRYADSKLGMTAPYRFTYSAFNPDYNTVEKDRWGNYKPEGDSLTNFEFPFVDQDADNNLYASAWSLTKIDLPSGGTIEVQYEADDYAYVETRKAMEMFRLTGVGSTSAFQAGNELYFSRDQPNLFLYFKRRINAEKQHLSFKQNYLPESDILYYNVPVELREGMGFEPVKGYARVKSIGVCPNNSDYGFLELEGQAMTGSSYIANPITYTALNLGRYSLPHILFPGQDYEDSDMGDVAEGLGTAIKELFQMNKNPLENLIKEDRGKYALVSKSFVRLGSPGLKKAGGGQRVKTLKFYDNWQRLVGGNAQNAFYGKEYIYTRKAESDTGLISSGVASYEPAIGGDELPQRMPVGYNVQAGTSFPPNDPVSLYQEVPIGESFYPSPTVGYSCITTRSLHRQDGQSSQSEQVETFYTAKDFPVEVQNTALNSNKKLSFSITGIDVTQTATQGFSIVLNDMHGKPRSVENYVVKPENGKRELVSSKSYEYQRNGGGLDNRALTYQYDGNKIDTATRVLGLETELAIDTRMRSDKSKSIQLSLNANGFIAGVWPVVIPLIYPWGIENNSEFKMAATTKITQRYGIMAKEVSNAEGTVTDVRNEVYDGETGMPVLTSVNNEFGDREYTTNYPAWWAYKELGPSYANHGFEGRFGNVYISPFPGNATLTNYSAFFGQPFSIAPNTPAARVTVSSLSDFRLGDELLVKFPGSLQPIRLWVMGYTADASQCYVVLQPREPYVSRNGWVASGSTTYTNVPFRVVRSGLRNRLMESVQSITATDKFNSIPRLQDQNLKDVISIKAETYKPALDVVSATGSVRDSLNAFVTGKVGNYRPDRTWLNMTSRDYATATMRNSGMFTSDVYWDVRNVSGSECGGSTGAHYINTNAPLFYSRLGKDLGKPTWFAPMRSTKYNALGSEIENNIEGIGPNAALYGYGSSLPLAVAKNAIHGDFLFESFDDMGQLQATPSAYQQFLKLIYSPFQEKFSRTVSIGATSPYVRIDTNGTTAPVQYKLTAADAHTGYYSLRVDNTLSVPLPIRTHQVTLSGATAPYSFFVDATGLKSYVVNVWVKPTAGWTNTLVNYTPNIALQYGGSTVSLVPKTGIIEGWQQFEVSFKLPAGVTSASLTLPSGYLYDDLKLFPQSANIKGFVYHPYTRKLMATLDENNYATFYEYDAEGNLIRTKRETEKGVLTISESRSGNPVSN